MAKEGKRGPKFTIHELNSLIKIVDELVLVATPTAATTATAVAVAAIITPPLPPSSCPCLHATAIIATAITQLTAAVAVPLYFVYSPPTLVVMS